MPITTAPPAVTNPHAGVMTTKPATAPEQKPSTLGLPRTIHSIIGQINEATAVARVVVVKALAAMTSAADRAAGVKSIPTDPQHSGADHAEHHAVRGEVLLAEPHALAEDDAQNQRGPTRGHVDHGPAREINGFDFGVGVGDAVHHAVNSPNHVRLGKIDDEHPQNHKQEKAENLMRSAMEPMIKAGVMMANIN